MEFRVRAEEGSIWKRFNRNLANVGRGRGGRNSRYARFSVRSRAGEFFTSTRGQHAAVHRRSDFAAPLEIIETHRGNEGSPFSLPRTWNTRVCTRTRGVDLLRVAGRGERNDKEKKGKALESWPFCDMLIFNDPGRNSLRSTYLLNGDV